MTEFLFSLRLNSSACFFKSPGIEEELCKEIKQLYIKRSSGILKKKWRNRINKLDQHLSNYLILQSGDSEAIMTNLLMHVKSWNDSWLNLATAVFIYCDFTIFYNLVNAGCPFNPCAIISEKYLISKTFKYNISNLSSLYLKLKYIMSTNNFALYHNLIKGYLIIYAPSNKKFAELLTSCKKDNYESKTIKKSLIKHKKSPKFRLARRDQNIK